jgi:hypothetical protein
MNEYIKTRINNETYYLTVTRKVIISEIEKIKRDDQVINGNLLHHIFLIKKIDLVLELLNDADEANHYLRNLSDQEKLNYFLDVRTIEDQLG